MKPATWHQLEVWEDFIKNCSAHSKTIPTFPIWAMEFGATYDYRETAPAYQNPNHLRSKKGRFGSKIAGDTIAECLACLPVYAQTAKARSFPQWKIKYIEQNRNFYEENKNWLGPWIDKIRNFENSHQKMEWNCGQDVAPTLYDKIIQFRASGIRIKNPTFSPALNLCGTQIPIFPWVELPAGTVAEGARPRGRYMTRREAAKLQGMMKLKFGDENFQFSVARSYAALGNAVNVTIVKHIAKNLIAYD